MSGEYLGNRIDFNLKLKNLTRGEKGKKKALESNQFNEFDKNEEALIFDVDYKLVKYEPEDDRPYLVSDSDFKYFKSDFSEYRSNNYLSIDNNLHAKVYKGGETTGKVGLVIPKDDNGYLVYKDSLWFKIK